MMSSGLYFCISSVYSFCCYFCMCVCVAVDWNGSSCIQPKAVWIAACCSFFLFSLLSRWGVISSVDMKSGISKRKTQKLQVAKTYTTPQHTQGCIVLILQKGVSTCDNISSQSAVAVKLTSHWHIPERNVERNEAFLFPICLARPTRLLLRFIFSPLIVLM